MPEIIDLRRKSKEHQPQEKAPIKIKEAPKDFGPQKVADRPEPKLDHKIYWEAVNYHPVLNKFGVYLFSIILFVFSGLLFYLKNNYLLAIFLALFAIVVLLNINRKPEITRVTIDKNGLDIDGKIYPFKDIRSFWINYNEYDQEILIRSERWYNQIIRLPLHDQNPLRIRSFLTSYINEEKIEKGLLENILNRIGF